MVGQVWMSNGCYNDMEAYYKAWHKVATAYSDVQTLKQPSQHKVKRAEKSKKIRVTQEDNVE